MNAAPDGPVPVEPGLVANADDLAHEHDHDGLQGLHSVKACAHWEDAQHEDQVEKEQTARFTFGLGRMGPPALSFIWLCWIPLISCFL